MMNLIIVIAKIQLFKKKTLLLKVILKNKQVSIQINNKQSKNLLIRKFWKCKES